LQALLSVGLIKEEEEEEEVRDLYNHMSIDR